MVRWRSGNLVAANQFGLRSRLMEKLRQGMKVEALAARLAKETGISVEQSRQLIELIGTDWNSLLREARLLNGGR
ncbi:hypothetical protein X730_11970 [Mesorhizobium sp. L103C565B0]|nr:hypothetical protein X730_11970 [Mesorhizobium sp. L103C565B0]